MTAAAKKIHGFLNDIGSVFAKVQLADKRTLKNALVGKMLGTSILVLTRREFPDDTGKVFIEVKTHFVKPDDISSVTQHIDKAEAITEKEKLDKKRKAEP